jgi:hypothetical protein
LRDGGVCIRRLVGNLRRDSRHGCDGGERLQGRRPAGIGDGQRHAIGDERFGL